MPRARRPRKSRRRRVEPVVDEYTPLLSPEAKRGVVIVLLIIVAFISILSLLDLAGVLGQYLSFGITNLFGLDTWLFPLLLLGSVYLMLAKDRAATGVVNYLGGFIFTLALNGLLHLTVPLVAAREVIGQATGGGLIGLVLSWPLQQVMGRLATGIVLAGLLLIGIILTLNTSLRGLADKSFIFNRVFDRLRQRWSGHDDTVDNEEETITDDEAESAAESDEAYYQEDEAVTTAARQFSAKQVTDETAPVLSRRYKKIDIPLDLLIDQRDKPMAGDIAVNQEKIKRTLSMFGIEVDMGEVSIGPTVTQYTLKPSEGVKLSQITTLHNDLALALAAHPIRIEAPIPGKSLVGIEVPNQSIAIVGMKEVLSSREFVKRKTNYTLGIGKDVAGKVWVSDLTGMPHMLIAGATGSGKSVCINTIITSLLYQNSPNTLRIIMVDPKRVELSVYNGVPHLLTPVITDAKKTINALKWTIAEMDRRYELLAKTSNRDIASFNKASREKMPVIVFIIDEMADLIQTMGNEVEGYIIRLAQLARAVGIHLILATQRPSVNVITGLIKANITTRIAFAVASAIDSRTILDFSGAEKLLGRGDMLYISASLSSPKRLQGAFISEDETRRVVEYLKGQNGEPDYDESITAKQSGIIAGLTGGGDSDGDKLLEEAQELILSAGKASASYLQRRLKIGYARAARILDLLEEAGIVGPADGAKPREIFVQKHEYTSRNTAAPARLRPAAEWGAPTERAEDEEIISDELVDEVLETADDSVDKTKVEDEVDGQEIVGEEAVEDEEVDEVLEELEELGDDQEDEEDEGDKHSSRGDDSAMI